MTYLVLRHAIKGYGPHRAGAIAAVHIPHDVLDDRVLLLDPPIGGLSATRESMRLRFGRPDATERDHARPLCLPDAADYPPGLPVPTVAVSVPLMFKVPIESGTIAGTQQV